MTDEKELEQVAQAQEEQTKDEGQAQNDTDDNKQHQESLGDRNWKAATETLASQKREIEELRAQMTQLATPKAPEEKDEFAELDPNDYLTVEQARKMAGKMAEKQAMEAAKKMVGEYAQQQHLNSDELRCRGKYEDYDYVIENFAIPQIKNDPALAYKIQTSKNPAEAAYKLGRLSDNYEETTMKQTTSPKAEKILKNTQRPVSSNAASESLKSQADQYSKLSQKEIWEMSQKYARQA